MHVYVRRSPLYVRVISSRLIFYRTDNCSNYMEQITYLLNQALHTFDIN